MEKYPPLTLSLLSQLTDRELQTNYLNHLDRTDEIAALLSQIIDRDLALHIIDLALEVDLGLGASLVGHLALDLQAAAVKKIDDLDICIGLKVELWAKTTSKAALPYLQNIVIFKRRYKDLDYVTISSAKGAILDLDRNWAIDLLLEDIYDSRLDVQLSAAETLAILAPIEAIEPFGLIICDACGDNWSENTRRVAVEGLINIGTREAIECLKTMLRQCKCSWTRDYGISALGAVAEPETIERLIYFIYLSSEYIERSSDYPQSNRYYVNKANDLCLKAMAALERVGGNLVFEVLHRALYWVDLSSEYPNPIEVIVSVLTRLDRDKTLTALEGAIQSYDPIVRKRAAMALGVLGIRKRDEYGNIPSNSPPLYLTDRNLLILLNAAEDLDSSVAFQIAISIRDFCSEINYLEDRSNIIVSQELIDLSLTKAREIVVNCIAHPDREIADKASDYLAYPPINLELFIPHLDSTSDRNIAIIIYSLTPATHPEHLQILLKYIQHEDLWVSGRAIEMLGSIGDDSILPMLVSYLDDPELTIVESAIRGIIRLGSAETLPILLRLASDLKFVAIVIRALSYGGLEDYYRTPKSYDSSRILETFRQNIDLTQQFVDTAETTLIEMVLNILDTDDNYDYRDSSGLVAQLGRISNRDRAVDAIESVMKSDKRNYDISEDAVDALVNIGTDRAIFALLGFLPDEGVLGGWIANKLYSGELALIPYLWSAQYQYYERRLADSIARIQQRSGLYNPNFSNKIHPLYQRSKPRLRDLLLESR